MVYTLRRYFRRALRFQSLSFWIALSVIIIILISTSTVVHHNNLQYLESDYDHPISTCWRKERLNILIQPEIETALIQPHLGNHQVCNNTIRNIGDPKKMAFQILIMVMSAPRNLEARQAIRETWGRNTTLPPEASVFFMLGTTPKEQDTILVQEEALKHNDIIVEDFLDSYDNLTIKSLFALKWASNKCSAATHLLKTDDDMLILVGNLIERLKFIRDNYYLMTQTISSTVVQQNFVTKKGSQISTENVVLLNKETEYQDLKISNYSEFHTFDKKTPLININHSNDHLYDNLNDNEGHLIMKDLIEDANYVKQTRTISGAYILGMIYQSVAPNRNKDSKWFLPWSLYDENYLPDFASGTAYVISNGNEFPGAIKSILQSSLKMKHAIPLEDVFITGIVAGRSLAIPLIQDNFKFHKAIPIVYSWSVSHLATCFYYDSIAIHGMRPTDIIIGWKHLRQLKEEECNTIQGYFQKNIYRFLTLFEMHISNS